MLELTVDQGCRLPGDELIANATKQITRSLTIAAPPEAIWPSLVGMVGARREQGCTVLRSDERRALVLGGLYDHEASRYLPFNAPKPRVYWQATWALVLSPIDAMQTRLDVRSRVAYTADAVQWTAVWTHPFSDFMEPDQLHRLKRIAEMSAREPHERRGA